MTLVCSLTNHEQWVAMWYPSTWSSPTKSLKTSFVRTANTRQQLNSSLSFSWCLVARRFHVVVTTGDKGNLFIFDSFIYLLSSYLPRWAEVSFALFCAGILWRFSPTLKGWETLKVCNATVHSDVSGYFLLSRWTSLFCALFCCKACRKWQSNKKVY